MSDDILAIADLFRNAENFQQQRKVDEFPTVSKIKAKNLDEVRKEKEKVWSEQDLQKQGEGGGDEAAGGRPPPQYEILLRQQVSAEDFFLNMSDRDTSSDHCEGFKVKASFMQNTTGREVSVDIVDGGKRLIAQSSREFLNLSLPYPVLTEDEPGGGGRAVWEKEKFTLSVDLIIRREIKFCRNPREAIEDSSS